MIWHGRDNLAERPAALDIAREAAELAAHRTRLAARRQEVDENQRARAAAPHTWPRARPRPKPADAATPHHPPSPLNECTTAPPQRALAVTCVRGPRPDSPRRLRSIARAVLPALLDPCQRGLTPVFGRGGAPPAHPSAPPGRLPMCRRWRADHAPADRPPRNLHRHSQPSPPPLCTPPSTYTHLTPPTPVHSLTPPQNPP